MEKFITQVVCRVLEPLVHSSLDTPRTIQGTETYLHHLFELHRRLRALELPLSKFKGLRMPLILKILLGQHLDNYVQTECMFIKARCTSILQQYYDVMSVEYGLSKLATVQVLPEVKELSLFSSNKSIPSLIGDYLAAHPSNLPNYETKLINESMALSILGELRQAAQRALSLVPVDDVGPCLYELGQTVVTNLIFIHLDYGLDIGIRALAPADPKSEPSLTFLELSKLAVSVCDAVILQVIPKHLGR